MAGIDICMLFFMLTSLALLGSSRLGACIGTVAAQGVLVGVLPLLAGQTGAPGKALALAAAAIGIKSVLFPWLMTRVLRNVEDRHERRPYLGYSASLFLGVLALAGALWLSRRLPHGGAGGTLALPAALFAICAGLILIVTRRKAVMQVLGYLVMENGIYVAGVTLVPHAGFLVELGILLDLFVGVFLMGILVFHIQREFDHIDADRLTALRDG